MIPKYLFSCLYDSRSSEETGCRVTSSPGRLTPRRVTLERTTSVAEMQSWKLQWAKRGRKQQGATTIKASKDQNRCAHSLYLFPSPAGPTSKTEKLRLIDAPREKIDFQNFRETAALRKDSDGVVVALRVISVICNAAWENHWPRPRATISAKGEQMRKRKCEVAMKKVSRLFLLDGEKQFRIIDFEELNIIEEVKRNQMSALTCLR